MFILKIDLFFYFLVVNIYAPTPVFSHRPKARCMRILGMLSQSDFVLLEEYLHQNFVFKDRILFQHPDYFPNNFPNHFKVASKEVEYEVLM